MADLTRRGFLGQMSVTTGVGIAGGLGLRQLLAGRITPASTTDTTLAAHAPSPGPSTALIADLGKVTLAGPMVVHVRDVPNAEVSIMVGTQELVYRDPEVVSRLVARAASAPTRMEA